MSSARRQLTPVWAGATLALALFSFHAGAQMPGAPVLQNAWAAPGIVVAADIAGGSGSSVYAGALGWAPASGRFQFSGGAGYQSSTGQKGRAVYGARVAMPVMQMMSGKLGIAAFAGIGGGAGTSKTAADSLMSRMVIPAGLAIGYRQAIGTSGRGFSVYVDPGYHYHSGDAGNTGAFRIGYGLDVGISSRFGLTLGGESGGNAAASEVGPRGASWGIGLSMKLGR